MELDSLSANRCPIVQEEDSLNFDLQEVAEEDSLTPDENVYEHDSLQPVSTLKNPIKQDIVSKGERLNNQPKKLIIPYNESFSSTTSVFTTRCVTSIGSSLQTK